MFEFIENVTNSTSKHTNFCKGIASPSGTVLFVLLRTCTTNEEFLNTVKGKKLKFTHAATKHVSKKTAFLQDINLASEQDENTFTKYWLPSELHQLKNKTNILKIRHLNNSSLQYHFAELHILLTTSEIQFDIIGVSE